jgi:hypothetical protein
MKKTETKTDIKTHKLRLNRQVVRTLQTHELGNVVGGTLTSRPSGVSGPPMFCCS